MVGERCACVLSFLSMAVVVSAGCVCLTIGNLNVTVLPCYRACLCSAFLQGAMGRVRRASRSYVLLSFVFARLVTGTQETQRTYRRGRRVSVLSIHTLSESILTLGWGPDRGLTHVSLFPFYFNCFFIPLPSFMSLSSCPFPLLTLREATVGVLDMTQANTPSGPARPGTSTTAARSKCTSTSSRPQRARLLPSWVPPLPLGRPRRTPPRRSRSRTPAGSMHFLCTSNISTSSNNTSSSSSSNNTNTNNTSHRTWGRPRARRRRSHSSCSSRRSKAVRRLLLPRGLGPRLRRASRRCSARVGRVRLGMGTMTSRGQDQGRTRTRCRRSLRRSCRWPSRGRLRSTRGSLSRHNHSSSTSPTHTTSSTSPTFTTSYTSPINSTSNSSQRRRTSRCPRRSSRRTCSTFCSRGRRRRMMCMI